MTPSSSISAQRTMLSAGSLMNAAGFRSAICTITRFGQILAMEASCTQRTPSSVLRRVASGNRCKAAAVVRLKEPQNLLARCVFHAVQLQVGALQSVVGRGRAERSADRESESARNFPTHRCSRSAPRQWRSRCRRSAAERAWLECAAFAFRFGFGRHLRSLPKLFQNTIAGLPHVAGAQRQNGILIAHFFKHRVTVCGMVRCSARSDARNPESDRPAPGR
jgi:hypothetical protein